MSSTKGTATPMTTGEKMGTAMGCSIALFVIGLFFPLLWVVAIFFFAMAIATAYDNLFWVVGDCPFCGSGLRVGADVKKATLHVCSHCKRTIQVTADGWMNTL